MTHYTQKKKKEKKLEVPFKMHYWQIVISDKQFLSFKGQANFSNRKTNKSWSQLTTLQVVGSQPKDWM
jgi:hypothetical protein